MVSSSLASLRSLELFDLAPLGLLRSSGDSVVVRPIPGAPPQTPAPSAVFEGFGTAPVPAAGLA